MALRQSVQTVHEQIAGQLRSEILGGQFRPHQPLREVRLAKRFGISRGPIRQVLQRLVQEGLLVAQPNRGARVAPQPSSEVRELLFPLRAQVETYALRLCFDELDAADFLAWERQLSRLQLACQERDFPAVLDYDFDFHRSILLRAGLDEVVPIWTLIVTRARGYYEQVERELDDLGIVYTTHVGLLDAFRAGDKEAAVKALSQHIMDGEFNERVRRRFKEAKGRIHASPRARADLRPKEQPKKKAVRT